MKLKNILYLLLSTIFQNYNSTAEINIIFLLSNFKLVCINLGEMMKRACAQF